MPPGTESPTNGSSVATDTAEATHTLSVLQELAIKRQRAGGKEAPVRTGLQQPLFLPGPVLTSVSKPKAR